MRVHTALALVLFGLLSGCGGGNEESGTRSAEDQGGCPRQLDLGEDFISASWSPVANKLAFSDRGVVSVLDTDTCEVAKVTEGYDFGWAPSGTKLVFQGDGGFFTANEDGSDVRQITVLSKSDSDYDGTPAWSPRGDLIAFQSHREPALHYESNSLAVVKPDGSGGRTILDLGAPGYSDEDFLHATDPAWSPDGRWLAWTECPGSPGLELCLVNLQGDARRFKIAGRVSISSVHDPSWSPDGKRIVFTLRYGEFRKYGPPGRLMLVAASGGIARPLLHKPPPPDSGGDFSPSWSADGRWIAFVRGGEFGYEIYLVRPDGTGLRRLTVAVPAAN